jgi:hypothetical protein
LENLDSGLQLEIISDELYSCHSSPILHGIVRSVGNRFGIPESEEIVFTFIMSMKIEKTIV